MVVFAVASAFGLITSAQAQDRDLERLERIKKILSLSRQGKSLLRQWAGTQRRQNEMIRVEFSGTVSKTDALLTRVYDPVTKIERKERQITISLREDASDFDASLDFAHELTHALFEPVLDPYDPELTITKYLERILYRSGGEGHALTNECAIATNLSRILKRPLPERCRILTNLTEQAEEPSQAILELFSRTGTDSELVRKLMGDGEFEAMGFSDAKPYLYSAAGGSTYPLALAREYLELTRAACENVKNRSVLDLRTSLFYQKRCHSARL